MSEERSGIHREEKASSGIVLQSGRHVRCHAVTTCEDQARKGSYIHTCVVHLSSVAPNLYSSSTSPSSLLGTVYSGSAKSPLESRKLSVSGQQDAGFLVSVPDIDLLPPVPTKRSQRSRLLLVL